MHHYIAYRASVRTKVACLRHAQGDASSAALAVAYQDLTLAHLERGRLRLVLVGGGPGTGKSTLAAGIGERYELPVLVTDEIRKDLTQTPRFQHRAAGPGEGIYDDATNRSVYDELLREAALLLDAGQGAVLDASWTDDRHRAEARSLADRLGAELVEIECVLDPETAKERVTHRWDERDNVSDATPEVIDFLAGRRDPWPTALALSTVPPPFEVLETAITHVDLLR
jgi:predicted kinase